ncbi:LysR family transcriptional regulator [[Mannheimia] succiniciproducens]|uniref:LysR protein n=1 Tax=Mannheimia succiniciproducens (strain KCTC 0769BP / MBEL55E) TaxID=221988 RepID=Q65QK1_MANSM|nr:LysR family transcriptional regulator [[Mannheimia] succiniciproducens]AAU38759.1 LysR protein [[Mannheimia] succiniciproducens MBEL55E]
MNDKFSGIEEFLMTVEMGSFSAAAERLNLTGSAVGKSISRLEQRLNTQLFHRSTRKITLTREGEVWLASCRRMMEELEQAKLLLSSQSQQIIGEIRIDLPTTYGRSHILPKLLAIQADYPKLYLNISFQDRKVDMIAEHIDIAVRFGELADLTDIIAKQIDCFQNQLCATPAFVSKWGKLNHPDDLTHFPCIVGNQISWRLMNEQGKSTGFPLNVQHQINDGDARLQAVLADCGIAFLPDWLIQPAVEAGKLVQLLPEFTPPPEPIYVLWQKKLHLQPKVKAIVNSLV